MPTRHKISNLFLLVCTFVVVLFERGACQSNGANLKTAPTVDSVWSSVGDTLRMGAMVTLRVSNFDSLLRMDVRKQRTPLLFVNDMPMRGLFFTLNPNDGVVKFQLSSNETTKAIWGKLQKVGLPIREVKLSVGWKEDEPLGVTYTKHLWFRVYYGTIFWTVVLALVVFAILLWRFVLSTDLLRDWGPSPPGRKQNTYSLGRFQMAFWFMVILAATSLIALVTGDLPALPDSVLALMGIAGGTALGAAVIDLGQPATSPKGQYSAMLEQLEQLELQVIVLQKQSPHSPMIGVLNSQVDGVKAKMSSLEKNVFSEGFLSDILSDNGGIDFHRFQIFIWTLFLGGVFLTYAISSLALKDFNTTWLALMGISSGTYIGFKLPAQKS